MQANAHEKERRLETILDGQSPDAPGLDTYASEEALSAATDIELEELLLQNPDMQRETNDAMRDQVLSVLAERHGPDYVAKLFLRAKSQDLSWEMWPVGDAQKHLDHEHHTPAERAREAFKEHNIPIWSLVPDDIEHFQIDDNGVWNMYLPDKELIHMPYFDVLLEDEISGIMEPDHCWNVLGIHAISNVHGATVDLSMVEFITYRSDVIVTTNHPLAPVVHIDPNDFLQFILP